MLDTLTPREGQVLRMRFGIEMNTGHPGSRQTIRRHPRGAFARSKPGAAQKLRHPPFERLKSFLDNNRTAAAPT